jgi:hypothetical protein
MSKDDQQYKDTEEYQGRGLFPAVDDDDPHAIVTLLRYNLVCLTNIQRVAYSLERLVQNGVIISLDGGVIETAKAMYLLARGEELDDVLLAKGGKAVTPSTAREALSNPLDGNDEPKSHPKTDGQTEMNTDPPPTCPKCGIAMEIRDGRNGPFFGCVNFRSKGCRETVDIGEKPWHDESSKERVGSFEEDTGEDDDGVFL